MLYFGIRLCIINQWQQQQKRPNARRSGKLIKLCDANALDENVNWLVSIIDISAVLHADRNVYHCAKVVKYLR